MLSRRDCLLLHWLLSSVGGADRVLGDTEQGVVESGRMLTQRLQNLSRAHGAPSNCPVHLFQKNNPGKAG